MNIKRRKHRFDFKQFSITQQDSAMKVGTDGVLLGSWMAVTGASRVLDIGTGTGLIALMIAQRCPLAKIDAIEIDAKSYHEAKINASQSPWSDRITIIQGKVQDLPSKSLIKYDMIISNPPYFTSGTLSPVDARHQARHHVGLSQTDLLDAVKNLLSEEGVFGIILPVQEGLDFIDLALEKGLFLRKELAFYAKRSKSQERWLLEFQKQPLTTAPEKQDLVQYDEKGAWTEAYKALTKDFYLKL